MKEVMNIGNSIQPTITSSQANLGIQKQIKNLEFSEWDMTGRGDDKEVNNLSPYQHYKQGLNFMDEANQEVRDLCKQSVGCSEMNDESIDERSQDNHSIMEAGKSKVSGSVTKATNSVAEGASRFRDAKIGQSQGQQQQQLLLLNADAAINIMLMNETTNLVGNSFLVSERKEEISEILDGKDQSILEDPNNEESASSSAISMKKNVNLNIGKQQLQLEEQDGNSSRKASVNHRLAVKKQSIDSLKTANLLSSNNNNNNNNNNNQLLSFSLKQPLSKQHKQLIPPTASIFSNTSPLPSPYPEISQRPDGLGYSTRNRIESKDLGIKPRNTSAQRTGVFSLKFLISIKPKIKKFITNRTTFGRTRVLSKRIRDFIADPVDYNRFTIQQNYFQQKIMNTLHSIEKLCRTLRLDKIPLFDPENKIKIVLNSIIVTYNCFYILMISVVLIFDAHMPATEEHMFNYIAMASWILEMLMEMNTVCYHNNHFVTDRRVIIQIYAKEYFFFEILPLIFEGRTSTDTLYNVLLHLPLLLKIKGMMIILKKLEFYILQILEKHYLFQLFKLIMQMLLYCHIVACSWNLVVKIEQHLIGSATWVTHSEIDSEKWWVRYLMAQYWSFSVMMNVTTVPTTPLELGFTSFIMLFSCIAFGYLLSTVAAIIADISRQQRDYKKDLNTLNSYMKRKKVDLGVKRRVNISLKTYYQQKSKDNLQVEKLALSKLSSEMLHELNCQANSRILKQFPFFTKLFSEQTLTRVYSIMEEEVYAPQQIVLRKGTQIPDNQYLYFILKGEVTILVEHFIAPNIDTDDQQFILNTEGADETHSVSYQEKDLFNDPQQQLQQQPIVRKVKTSEDPAGPKREMGNLKSGHIFGAFSFFTGLEGSQTEFKCKEFTTLVKIQRSQFLDVIMENKKDFERFCEIRDKMSSERLIDDMPGQECLICGSKEHRMKQCGFGGFDKYNLLLFFKHNHSKNQERQPREYTTPLKPNRQNARKNFLLNIQRMQDFRKDNDFEWYSSLLNNEFEEDYEEETENNENNNNSRQNSYRSHQSENQQKPMRSMQFGFQLPLEEDFSKSLFPSQVNATSTANFQSPPLINNFSKPYPSSEIEVLKLEEEGNQNNTDDHNNNNQQDDPNQQNNQQAKPSPSANVKRGAMIKSSKPYKSLLKMNDSNIMINSSSNSYNNINSTITTNNPSSNPLINPIPIIPNSNNINPRNRVTIGETESNLLLRKKLSFVNASPKTIQNNNNSEANNYYMQHSQTPIHHSFSSYSNVIPTMDENYPKKKQSQFYQNNLIMHSQTMSKQQQYQQQATHQQYTQLQEANQHTTPITSKSNPSDNQYHQLTVFTGHSQINPVMSQNFHSNNDKQNINYRKFITLTPFSIDEQTLLWSFERQRDYQSYFPYYNCQNVLRRIQTYQQKNFRSKRTKHSRKLNSDGQKRKTKIMSSASLAKGGGGRGVISTQKEVTPEKDFLKQGNEIPRGIGGMEGASRIEKSNYLPVVNKNNDKALQEIFRVEQDKNILEKEEQ